MAWAPPKKKARRSAGGKDPGAQAEDADEEEEEDIEKWADEEPPAAPAKGAAQLAAPGGGAEGKEVKEGSAEQAPPEEADPLDAFMADLAKAPQPAKKNGTAVPAQDPILSLLGPPQAGQVKSITLDEIEALHRAALAAGAADAEDDEAAAAPAAAASSPSAGASSSSTAPPPAEPAARSASSPVPTPSAAERAKAEEADDEGDDEDDDEDDDDDEEEDGQREAAGAAGGAVASSSTAGPSQAASASSSSAPAAAASPSASTAADPASAEAAPGAPDGAADAQAAAPGAKVVESKKERRRKRREAKEAAAKAKAIAAKKKAAEGFGGGAEAGDQLMENDPDRSEQSSEEKQESYFDLVKRFTTKKSLPAVDHSTIEYAAFRKNLYIQVKEITNMKDHEVEDLRRTHGDIRVRGKLCPRPVKSFLQCGLPEKILKLLEKREYEKPFPIQMQAIPALMCGRDMIGVAQTGSGKTLAYLLPAIRHILDQPPLKDGDGPIAFVIAPTRELALQIQREANHFCKAVKLTSVCAYGGGPMGEQLAALKRGAELLVGTPGRLIDVLTTSGGKITNLRRVTFMVLDEADRMFDMGFEPQIGMFLQSTRPDKQVALFSATLPTHVEALARQVLKKPLEITVGERNTAATNVTQYVEVLEETQKFYRLLQLLGEWHEHGSIIIFVHQQKDVDEMFTELLKFGYPALALHGGQDQHDRDFTLQDFKDGVANILVATSVAARGIDVKQVILVINFKVPDHLEDYIHRIGRTGRAGKAGFAYTFIQPDEGDKAQDMVDALRQCGQEVPHKLKQLADEFQSQVNTGQAQKRRRWGGFGGKGFKYDNSEKSQQQKDRQKAKSDLLIGDAGERLEEEEKFRDPWNEDKPLSKAAQEKAEKEKERQAAKAAPAVAASPSSTVAAAAAVAARMQAELAKAAPAAPPPPGVGSTPADFVPSVAFVGARPGMSFKLGPRGLGYYTDTPPGQPAPAGAAAGQEAMPPPPPRPAPPPPKAKAGGPFRRKTEEELDEEAREMAEKTLKSALEGERGAEVREKQLPALTAKLKEKLRKAQEEQAAAAAAAATPPPPPKAVVAPPPAEQEPLIQVLPLVPGVLGMGAGEPNMVLRSMEQIQNSLAQSSLATVQEAKDMAALLSGQAGPLVPAGMHADELEINDYPQIARQKISHRDPLLAIEELTGAKCQVKGQYFADARKMPEGARKLYVEIIGPTVIAVQKAKHEVHKMMEALAIRTLNIPGVSRAVMGTPGRYDPAVGK